MAEDLEDNFKTSGEKALSEQADARVLSKLSKGDADRAAERERSGAIADLCRRHGLDATFEQGLIRSGATIEDARAKVLDQLAESDPLAGRSFEPAPAQARSEGASDIAFRDGMHSALMHRVNPAANALSDGGRQFRGMSLLEIARDNLERRGVTTRGMSRMGLSGVSMAPKGAVMRDASMRLVGHTFHDNRTPVFASVA